MAKVAVIGAGAWGTAIALQAARKGHAVTLWAREAEVIRSVRDSHVNEPFLPGISLPESIDATGDRTAAVADAALVVLVPPSKFLRDVAASIASAIAPGALVVVASKGIEEASLKLMSEVMAEAAPELAVDRLAFLSGPTFAKEVALGKPCNVVAASRAPRAAARAQELLHSPFFRVYVSSDPVGVEIGGALKNVMAIAAGAVDALELGLNARAGIITRALAEMTRFGVALGADPLTFLGLAGMGDLVLTCTGELSRNRQLGVEIARGADPAAYVASRRTVAEGYTTARAAWALAQKLGVDAPIIEQVYYVLHEGRPLIDSLKALTTRESKDELAGIRL
jgi:glycerol-3-phosphate dehydrogenase (NAD(P)+)